MEFVKIYKPTRYTNLLLDIPLSSVDIKNSIKEYKAIPLRHKNQRVEKELELPIILKSFYSFFELTV